MIRRDLLLTLFGIGAGQAILLVTMPFLARAYGPAAFGTYSVIVAVAGIVATIAALRIDLAVSGAVNTDVAPLTRASLLLPLIVVPVAIGLLAMTLHLPLAAHLPFQDRDLPMIGVIALFQGWVFVGSGLSTRFGSFAVLAAAKVAQPLVFALTALLVLDDLPLSMAIGWIVALLATVPSLRRISVRQGWHDTIAAVRRMWRFPAISTPMALLDVLALSLPLLVIASVFGERSAGNYAQVQRLIGAPLVLVATAGGQIFLKHAGDRIRSGTPVLLLLVRFVLAMLALALGVMLAVAVAGHAILTLLVGSGWRTDTVFLLLALLPVLCRVIASPVSSVLILTHRIGTLGIWQISYFAVTAFTLLIASHHLGFEGTLAAVACSEFVMYSIYLFLSVRAARDAAGPSVSALRTDELAPTSAS